MIKLSLRCDFCFKTFESETYFFPANLLHNYKALKCQAIEAGWVYHTSNKRLYCPNCAEYRNAYEGELTYKNRDNYPGWHYPESGRAQDLPSTENGVSETVINQDGDEVFWATNSGWLYSDPVVAERAGSPYAKVYKWKPKYIKLGD